MKRILAVASVFLFLLALASIHAVPVALAHSEPKDCTPAIGGTVDVVPTQIVCKTTQAMDPKESSLRVLNATGAQVDKGDSTVDLNDPDRLTISVSLDTAKITDGVYTVKYKTLSTEDNEEAEGEFTFTVQLAKAGATPTAGETRAMGQDTPTAAPVEATATPAPVEPTATLAPVKATATPVPVEATATSVPVVESTTPAAGGEASYGLFALIAVAALIVVGAGALAVARARRK